MKELFMKVLELSLSGSLVILAVMALRPVLRKAPRQVFCLLWLLAALRLMLPIEIESRLSLQPEFRAAAAESVQQKDLPPEDTLHDFAGSGEAQLIPAVTPETQAAEVPKVPEMPQAQAGAVVNATPGNWDYMSAAAWLWAAGVAGLLLYSLLSYFRLKRRVHRSVIVEEGIWACGDIDSAFVLGFFRPQTYLPVGLPQDVQRLILAHERAHIARLDHWSKAAGFLVLAVHWFNPLAWLAYMLLCRDIEMACDEAVVKSMTVQERKAYSAALLRCSDRGCRIAACPVAFSEISVKRRIINVLNYRKKGFWIMLAAVIAVVVVSVCFLTSPAEVEDGLSSEPFATATEPGAWARGIRVDAVKSAKVYVRHSKAYSAEGHTGSVSRYEYTEGQLEALLAVLNKLPDGIFGPEQQLDRTSFGFLETSLGSYQGVSVTILDEVNDLAVLLRLRDGGTVDITMTDEPEKVEADAYVDNLRCWTIQSMELSAYLQGLLEQLSAAIEDNTDAIEETMPDPMPEWGVYFRMDDDLLTQYSGQIFIAQREEGTATLAAGSEYWFEKKNGAEWEVVPTLTENVSWPTERYGLGTVSDIIDLDWTELYGPLSAGTYRIGKEISDGFVTHTYYSVFRIRTGDLSAAQEAAVERCYAAVEELLQSEFAHYKVTDSQDFSKEFWWNQEDYLDIQSWGERYFDANNRGRVDILARMDGVGYMHVREKPNDRRSEVIGMELSTLSASRTSWDESVVEDSRLSTYFVRDNTLITFPEGVSVIRDEEVTFRKYLIDNWYVQVSYHFDKSGRLTNMEYTTYDHEIAGHSLAVEIYDTSAAEIDGKIRSYTRNLTVDDFSWADDKAKYTAGKYNIREDGFVNTDKAAISDAVEAARHAIREYPDLGEYLSLNVSYDTGAKMWKVRIRSYYDDRTHHEYRTIYMDSSGVTKLLTYEGPVYES